MHALKSRVMSSIRVPEALRQRLNVAAPPGTALHEVIASLLEEAGGPEAVRQRLDEASRREEAKARIARLRREGHRSVVLGEGEQVSLAEAADRWCRLLEKRGRRRWDPQTRTLEIAADPSARASDEQEGEKAVQGQTSRDRVRPGGRFSRAPSEGER
jgi:hypothetical protein